MYVTMSVHEYFLRFALTAPKSCMYADVIVLCEVYAHNDFCWAVNL
jgi:hypothetical protein